MIGSGGWSKQPLEAEAKFTYSLSLESSSGETKTLAVDVKTGVINEEVRTSRTMNLGQYKVCIFRLSLSEVSYEKR